MTEALAGLSVDLWALEQHGISRTHVGVELPIVWLRDVLADTDAEITTAGRVDVDVTLQPHSVVVVSGRLKLGFTVPCGRCLEPAAVDGGGEVRATFFPKPIDAGRHDAGEDEGLTAEDLDAWTYAGRQLDLAPAIAEQVKLAYPMRAFCRRGEACRGLCSSCGAPLNDLAAQAVVCAGCGAPLPGLEPEPVGPLAAALSKLQLPE